MTPSLIRALIVSERVSWIRQMLSSIRSLPLGSFDEFSADPRNPAAAESYLRRALEALLDLGRHILAKGFAIAVTEYKDIAVNLSKFGILSEKDGRLLRDLAGYRNRMVHFYHEVTLKELYDICSTQLKDIEHILNEILLWLKDHPEKLDSSL